MASPSLALQKAVGAALAADAGVTALVPPERIADRHGLPAAFPSIVLGDDQEVPADLTLARAETYVHATLHAWTMEPGTVGVKRIADAIQTALLGHELELDGFALVDFRSTGSRVLRDPDGDKAHAVISFTALVQEIR